MNIRLAIKTDEDAIWDIFHAVIAPGDTYVFDPAMSREEALAYWFRTDTHTYVAESDGRIVGTYILKPNQPALGSHVANAAFMVSPSVRGLGTGRRMGEHCLAEPRRLGFRAMRFNFVVATNEPAVRLFRKKAYEAFINRRDNGSVALCSECSHAPDTTEERCRRGEFGSGDCRQAPLDCDHPPEAVREQ